MKKLKLKTIIYGTLILTVALNSCKKPKQNDGSTTTSISQKVYVLNEGNFGSGNASVSIYDASNNNVYNDLFNTANSRPIGDVLQSMTLVNSKAYFVVNNSNKIEITNTYPLTSVGVIHGFSMPRYMVAPTNNKAYVSEYINFSGANGRLSIIDLTTNTITGTVAVGIQPENMLLFNGRVYVCNSGDTLISIINTTTDLVESKIKVSDAPNSIAIDANGKLWVLCSGITKYNNVSPYNILSQSAGALVRIDPLSNLVEATYTFPDASGLPAKLTTNGAKNKLYYSYLGGIYSQSISATSLPTIPIITRDFYGMGVDPHTEHVYIGTNGFTSNQKMIRYQSSGTPIDSIEVGVGPNGFVFAY